MPRVRAAGPLPPVGLLPAAAQRHHRPGSTRPTAPYVSQYTAAANAAVAAGFLTPADAATAIAAAQASTNP